MKLALVALMLFVSNALHAQSQPHPEKNRPSRQELSQAQASYIAKQLAFDEATSRKFEEVFRKQQQEIWALSPQGRDETKPKDGERSEAEIERAIQQRFDRSEQILAIRKKYYAEYRRFLSPQQIERFYQLEHRAMGRLGKHGRGGRDSFDSLKRAHRGERDARQQRHQR